ncbi:uncharacterized protein [Watersipora subatra]|uniref:uncharacterized protein isoform X2 n=1 Tax=Watersipora subatra TaxID=2589382 RepID=UPI00355B4434
MMDSEQQKLAEEIKQIELVLNSADSLQQNRRQQQTDEEVDSDEEEELCISADKGIYNSSDLQPIASTSNQDEENLYERDDSDEELGDTLETALKLNRAYQELLRYNISNIKELLNRNAEQQRIGQQQLASDISEKPKKLACYDIMTYPYFKDEWGSGPPKNRDTELRDFLFPKIELPKVWKIYQEELLLQCLDEQMKAKCLKDLHLRLKKCRQGVVDTGQEGELEADLLFTIESVRSSFSLADVPVEDVIEHADWLTIANHHLDGQFSSESCICLYRNVCNPLVNRSQWMPPEDEELKLLVEQHGHQQWVLIAEELGTDRTAFLCLQRYQQTLNDYATDTWSKEKADLLYKHVTLNLGKEDIISWDKVAWMVGDMSATECKNHWEQMSRGGKRMWTFNEDLALIEAVKLYSSKFEVTKKWIHIAAHVKTRNSMQCRDRWLNRLCNDFTYMRWSYSDNLTLVQYLQGYNSDPCLVGTKYDIASLRKQFPNRANNSITQRLRIMQRKILNGTAESFLNSVKAKEEKERENAEETKKKRAVMPILNRTPRNTKASLKSSQVQEFLQQTRCTTRDELESSGAMEEVEIRHCLRQLLSGYPISICVSETVRETLENCIHMMTGNENIQLTMSSVKEFLFNRNKLWKRQTQARVRQRAQTAMDHLSANTIKDYTPTEEPVKLAESKSTSAHVEAQIVKVLTKAHNSAKLPVNVYQEYSRLIHEALASAENSNELELRHSSERNARFELPYLLPPNQITLNAYYRLMSMRRALTHYAREHKDSNAVADAVSNIRLTDHYQALLNRLKSAMFWPAALSKLNPDAFTPESMSFRKYTSKPKEDQLEGFASSAASVQNSSHQSSVQQAEGSVEGSDKGNTSSQQSTTVSGYKSVGVLPVLMNIPIQIHPSVSQGVEGGNDESANALNTELSVNLSTASGKKLPKDVAAIIFKALQNKKSANDGIAKPVNNVIRKQNEGPYDTVVLRLASQAADDDQNVKRKRKRGKTASSQSNAKVEGKNPADKKRKRPVLMKKSPESGHNGELDKAALPVAKELKISYHKKRVFESVASKETVDRLFKILTNSRSNRNADSGTNSDVITQTAVSSSGCPVSVGTSETADKSKIDLSPSPSTGLPTPKKSPRKQTLPRKSISPSKPSANLPSKPSKVPPEKLRNVLKQIHMRSSPSRSCVIVGDKPDAQAITKTNLLPQLSPSNDNDMTNKIESVLNAEITNLKASTASANVSKTAVYEDDNTHEVLIVERRATHGYESNKQDVPITQEPKKWYSKMQPTLNSLADENVKYSPKKLRKRSQPTKARETMQMSGESSEEQLDDSDVDEDYIPEEGDSRSSLKKARLL